MHINRIIIGRGKRRTVVTPDFRSPDTRNQFRTFIGNNIKVDHPLEREGVPSSATVSFTPN